MLCQHLLSSDLSRTASAPGSRAGSVWPRPAIRRRGGGCHGEPPARGTIRGYHERGTTMLVPCIRVRRMRPTRSNRWPFPRYCLGARTSPPPPRRWRRPCSLPSASRSVSTGVLFGYAAHALPTRSANTAEKNSAVNGGPAAPAAEGAGPWAIPCVATFSGSPGSDKEDSFLGVPTCRRSPRQAFTLVVLKCAWSRGTVAA